MWRTRALPQCEVDLAPLREAFLRSGLTAGDVARTLGWTRTNYGRRVNDSGRVKRYLGISPCQGGGQAPRLRERCSYKTAVMLAEAIGVDPVDVGL
jgi:hypothetical protein